MNLKKEKNQSLIIWAGLYFMILCLCLFFVSTVDDYYIPEEGNSFLDSLRYAWGMGNGRYLGNILGNYLSLRFWPNVLVKSGCIWLMIRLTASFFGDDPLLLCLSAVLILWPGTGIYAQCYPWSHGFYNYVIPVTLLLAERKLATGNSLSPLPFAAAVLCAFAKMLCSENSSVIFVLLAGFEFYRQWKSADRARRNRAAVLLLATLLGAMTMFLLPKLSGNATPLGGYRGLYSLSDLKGLVLSVGTNVFNIVRALIQCHLLWGSLLAVLAFHIFRKDKKQLRLFALLCVAAVAALVLQLTIEGKNYLVGGIIFVLFMFALVLAICFCGRFFSRATLLQAAVPFVLALLSAGELLPVYPIGPRCLYITYFCLLFSVLPLWREEISSWPAGLCHKVQTGLAGLFLAAWVVLMASMISLFRKNQERIDYIKQQLAEGKTEIEVIALPENGLLWVPNDTHQLTFSFNQGDCDAMVFTVVD